MLVHLRWRCYPQLGRQSAVNLFEHFARRAEVADVGHTRTNEHFIDLRVLNLRERLHIVWIVRAGEKGLFDLIEIDLDDFVVFRVSVGFHELRVGEPCFHGLSAALQRACVLVSLFDHPAQHSNVRAEVFLDGLAAKTDSTAACRALRGGV